jgi:hypothetical protein
MNRLAQVLFAVIVALGVFAAPDDVFAAEKPQAKKPVLVDINSASVDALQALPGVGEAYAKRIVKSRPYDRKDQLVSKNVIPQSVYDKIENRIVARDDAPAALPRTSAREDKPRDAKTKPSITEERSKPSLTQEQAARRGLVWVNTRTGVYHHEGDRWYGTTKQGRYMTVAEAEKAGYRESKQTASGR